ncbi:hypothetical protein [Kineothrix sedimenti]|uniref:Uncharacterized protein n=1 Tax=Kineothrix sedimenti TaxID=3123317 RepID=A0ABZ3EV15_9FIRM
MERIENHMVCDWWWNEIEYGVKHKTRLEREQEALEEAERENNYGF